MQRTKSKKSYFIWSVIFIFLFSLLGSVYLISIPAQSGSGSFSESFDDAVYKDAANTTADWDAGKVILPWSNGAWTKADGLTEGFDKISDKSDAPSFQIDSNNNIYMAWFDQTTPSHYSDIFFSKWNPLTNQWEKMDGTPGYENITNTSGHSDYPYVMLDASENPMVVYGDDTDGDMDVYFTRWDGSQWVKMDGTPGRDNLSSNSTDSLIISDIPAVLDSNYYPYIVWYDTDPEEGDREVYFTHWDGSQWTGMDGMNSYDNLSNDSTKSYIPEIQLDSNDNPYVIWSDRSDYEIYFTHWDTSLSQWTTMDGVPGYENISNNEGTSESPKVLIDANNNPYIMWEEWSPGNKEIFFTRWDGSQWVKMDGAPGVENITNTPLESGSNGFYFQLDSANNPYLVEAEDSTGEIYFTHWDGSQWAKMDGTVGFDNLSNNIGDSECPKVLLDSLDMPYVVWRDETTGNGDIYFTHWNGSQWTGMDGTAGYDNIANNLPADAKF